MTGILTLDDVFVGEGDGVATVTFSLSDPATSASSIDFFTSNGTAVNGSDYSGFSTTTVSFAVGEQTKTVDIPLINSSAVEGNEYFFVNLINPVGITPEDRFSTVFIVDNDNGSRAPYVSTSDVWVDETDGVAKFEILIDRVTTVPLTVNYTTQSGSATSGTDFTTTSGSAVFAPGEMVKTISVPIIDDATAERSETFKFNLTSVSGVTGAEIADGSATGFISKSDGAGLATPSVSILDTTINEGVADGTVDIVLKLNAPSTNETSVQVFTSNNTAVNGSDYGGVGTLTVVFEPGETVRTIRLPILENSAAENVEHFFANLTNPVGLTINKTYETISIIDNDASGGAPIASVADKQIDEKDGFAIFSIILDKVSSVPITVSYQTVSGSATAGSDFRTNNGSVTFNPGETSAEVAVEIIDDTAAEIAEIFEFNLTGISGVTGAQIADGEATGTISLSDTPTSGTPNVTLEHVTVSEGKTDMMAEVVLRLDTPTNNATSVQVFTSNANAVNGSDYSGLNTTVRFEPGETVKVIEFGILQNTAIEGPETFYMNLTNPTGLSITQSYKTFTIYDDDAGERAPIISVFDRVVDEKDEFVHFDIVMDRSSPVPLTVSYETLNGSAVSGSDYQGQSGSVTFNPFETVKTVSIPIVDDAAAEAAQNFYFNITEIEGFTGASVAKGSAEATIGLSDTTPLGTPSVSIAESTVTEGAFDPYVELNVVLNAPSTILTSVQVFTSNSTAVNGSDYRGISTTVSFLPGETVKTIKLPTIDNTASEPTETFNVTLTNPSGLIIPVASKSITILDDETSQVSVSVTDIQKDEGDAGATLYAFVATRSGDLTTAQTVDWAAEGFTSGTVSANGADFTAGSFPTGTISFAIGETQKTFNVSVAGDTTEETDETFAVRLSNPSAGLVVLHDLSNATIRNDDASAPTGTNGNDNLTGTPGNDEIFLLDGNDVYTALGGSDSVSGGNGNDTLRGDAGNDTLEGDSGNDQITAGNGNDNVDGGAGFDLLFGNGGADDILGGTGNDTIFGGAGNDTISAGGSNDEVLGQGGADDISGDNGADTLRGGSGNDTISGGGSNDLIFGNGNNDLLLGDSGNDTLQGAGGLDTLIGGTGNDILTGGDGVDSLDGGTGEDIMNGGANTDRFVFADNYDEDRINGFVQGEDIIELDAQLWAGNGAISTAQDVVNFYGSANGTGSIITLDFGGGDILEVQNGAGLNLATLGDDILIA